MTTYKKSSETLDEVETTFEAGVAVYTLGSEQEWFHNWPGIVQRMAMNGKDVVVEFMGFGPMPNRTKTVPARELRLLSDSQVNARLDRILRGLRLLDPKPRGSGGTNVAVVPTNPISVKRTTHVLPSATADDLGDDEVVPDLDEDLP